jgi:hypothetical protein
MATLNSLRPAISGLIRNPILYIDTAKLLIAVGCLASFGNSETTL